MPTTIDQLPLLPYQDPSSPWTRIMGHAHEIRGARLGFIQRLAEAGDMCRLRFYVRSVALVTAPALVQEVLVEKARHFEKSPILRYILYPLAGEGLFTSKGELWRRQRRLMAPLFQPGAIAGFAQDMVDCALRGCAGWQDGAVVDLSRETTRITMSIAGKTLFDADTFSEADEIGAALTVALNWAGSQAGTVLPIAQTVLRKGLERVGAPWARNLAARLHGPVLLVRPQDRRLKEAVALLNQRVQRMIDERRAAGPGRQDLLARLLSAHDEDDGARMSDQQVRDEILTLFIAGHETTATALAWALYLLARHPEAYARARDEADALGRMPRSEDLPRLPYALRVFKEALRLYPPVALSGREVCSAVEIGGCHLPENTVVFVSPYATQHRADLWPDPERFDPERFLPEAEEARPRHAYLPFGAGPRVCIGNHFALMEGPLVLATLLRRADFALAAPGPIEPEPQATLRPKGGVPMRVRLRG